MSEQPVPPSPGQRLQEELLRTGLTRAELAERIHRPLNTVADVINGRRALTRDLATAFERTTGVPATEWLALEAEFQARRRLAEARERSQAREASELPWTF